MSIVQRPKRAIAPAAAVRRAPHVLFVAAPASNKTLYTIRPTAAALPPPPKRLATYASSVMSNSDGDNSFNSSDELDVESVDMDYCASTTPGVQTGQTQRKRERLTHLSPEEKMWRRKMKNRIAAQTARDRKRIQMDSMDTRLSKLEVINRKLAKENAELRAANAQLMAAMRARGDCATTGSGNEHEVVRRSPFESAAFINVPQQREQGERATTHRRLCMPSLIVSLLCSLLPHQLTSTPNYKPSSTTFSKTHRLMSMSRAQRQHLLHRLLTRLTASQRRALANHWTRLKQQQQVMMTDYLPDL